MIVVLIVDSNLLIIFEDFNITSSFHSFLKAPENFAFVDAVDLLYKVHKVFDLDFSPAIKHLMDFLDCFVYNNEFDDASITATMRKINNDFLAVSIE